MTHGYRQLLLVAGVTAGLAVTATAQDAPRRPQRAATPSMERRAGAPTARMQEWLGLTDAQMKQLDALRAADAARPSREPDMLRAQADLMQAMQGEGDLAAARRAMERMNALRTDAAIQRLEARQRFRAVLTAEQRTKLDAMRGGRGMRGRTGMMGDGRRGRARGWMGARGAGAPRMMRGDNRMGPPMGMMMGPPMGPMMREPMGPMMDGPMGPMMAPPPAAMRRGRGAPPSGMPPLERPVSPPPSDSTRR
ncbi:MAG: Spy/CpxP family protein refolding chaperone [Gemmatimonadaceae bacterium]|jgi:Spy/CpxP family protein refolding chaperone|nr:Spy/CpxP family protein refolding chaperone [Gemmatimonadaceae bacterium]